MGCGRAAHGRDAGGRPNEDSWLSQGDHWIDARGPHCGSGRGNEHERQGHEKDGRIRLGVRRGDPKEHGRDDAP